MLTTKVARDFQQLLDQEPDTGDCDSRAGLEAWKLVGPLKLSDLAMQSHVPIDLSDEKFKIISYADTLGINFRVVDVNTNACPDVNIRRTITKDGQIGEGQYSKENQYFCRVFQRTGRYYIG